MAKTTFIETPDELKTLQEKAHEQRDRFYLGVVQGHKREPSKAQKRKLKRKSIVNSPQEGRGSLFKFLSPFWRSLTSGQKDLWAEASQYSSLNNWQLFISDNAVRIRNSLSFPVIPSELWQVRAGHIVIEDPASELILKQEHPLDYIVAQKIPGRSWKSELVTIHEPLVLPITLNIRYKSDLTSYTPTENYYRLLETGDKRLLETGDELLLNDGSGGGGGDHVARYKATVWSSYQGQDIYTDFSINFTPQTDWTFATITTSNIRGIIIGYTLQIEIVGYRGELFFDNIEALHSGTNWARDPRCDEINKEFKKAFAVVPPFWIPVSQPNGSSFSSIFPPVL